VATLLLQMRKKVIRELERKLNIEQQRPTIPTIVVPNESELEPAPKDTKVHRRNSESDVG